MSSILIDALIDAGVFSLTYLLVSIGFVFMLSIARIPNLAYVLFFGINSYLTFSFLNLNIPYLVSFLISTIISLGISCTLFVLLDKVRGLELNEILGSYAFLLFGTEVITSYYGIIPYYLPSIFPSSSIYILNTSISIPKLALTFGVGALLFILFILMKTKIGILFQAVAQAEDTTRMIGINVWKIKFLAILLSTLMIVIATLFMVPVYGISPSFLFHLIVVSIVIVVAGGIGSIKGPLLVALIIGFSESLVAYFLSARLRIVIPFLVFLIILLVKPEGLYGERYKIWQRV